MSSIKEYSRYLEMNLPPGQSAFLWGGRQTGKSTYLKKKFSQSPVYDLLQNDVYFALLQEPQRLRQELLAKKPPPHIPVIIDEVQRVPDLLQEIHWLIENARISFILCGSSARQLKRKHAHLLGGRAWRYQMFPLTSNEIGDVDLLQAMQRGLLPGHYQKIQHKKSLEAYIYDYLTEEIRAEGLTRNLPAFTKFLFAASFSNAQRIEYKNIASDCGVDSKTVKEYFEILIDTHLGYLITPFTKKTGRKTITATPKFYFFDIGIANHLSKTNLSQIKGQAAGFSFENFILMELMAYRSYSEKDFTINYWHTKTQLEVDFVLNRGQICIETTLSEKVRASDIRGLVALMEESSADKNIVVCQEKRPRRISITEKKHIMVLPWQTFLKQLWQGDVL